MKCVILFLLFSRIYLHLHLWSSDSSLVFWFFFLLTWEWLWIDLSVTLLPKAGRFELWFLEIFSPHTILSGALITGWTAQCGPKGLWNFRIFSSIIFLSVSQMKPFLLICRRFTSSLSGPFNLLLSLLVIISISFLILYFSPLEQLSHIYISLLKFTHQYHLLS